MNTLYVLKSGCLEYVKIDKLDFICLEGRKRVFSCGYCYYIGELDNRHGCETKYGDYLFWYDNKKLL